MGVHTVIPVKEALNVNNIALSKSANGGINVGLGAGKVNLNTEAVISAVLGKGHVYIVAGLAVLVAYGLNGHTGELCKHILILDKLISVSDNGGKIGRLCNPGILKDLEGSVNDLNLACPLSLNTGDLKTGSNGHLVILFLGASKLVNEVCAGAVLKIEGTLVIPPGLLTLNEALDNYVSIDLGSSILCIGHSALALLANLGDLGDVGVHTVIPVKEALNVNNIALSKSANSGINVAVSSGKVNLNTEAVFNATLGKGHVYIVTGLAVLVAYGLNDHTGELCKHILILDKLISVSDNGGKIGRLCNPGILKDLEGSVNDLNLACPLSLNTGDLKLGSNGHLVILFLGASKLVYEVRTVSVLKIERTLVVPPGLLALNEALDNYVSIDLCSSILCIGHSTLALFIGVNLAARDERERKCEKHK